MKIHGTAKGGALSKKDFGVAFSAGGAVSADITFDSQVYTTTTTTGTTLDDDITIADNDDRILIVSAGAYNASPTISGVTFGSQDFTQINTQDITGIPGRCDLWYLLAPTVSTNTVTVTWSGDAGRRGFGALSFYNVSQSDPIGVTNTELSTVQVGTVEGNLTPTTANSMIIDGVLYLTGQEMELTLTAGFAVNITDPGGADRAVGMQYDLDPTIDEENAMEYTSDEDARYAWVGAEILPA